MPRPSGRSRSLALAAAGLLTAAVGVLPAAAATVPSLTLTPSEAFPGQVVHVAGAGFAAHLNRSLGSLATPTNPTVTPPTPPPTRSSTTTPPLPPTLPQPHLAPQLTALSSDGSIAAGGGSASTGDAPCVLLLGGTTVGPCVLDRAGGLTGSLTVPLETAPGTSVVEAESAGGNATATLQVKPPVTINAPRLFSIVPDVRHRTVRDARAELGRAGLRLLDGGVRADRRIVEQVPTPGTRVRRGTSVAVALLGGPTKGRHPASPSGSTSQSSSPSGTPSIAAPIPSPTSSTNLPRPGRTAGATAVQLGPAVSSLSSVRTLEVVAGVAGLLLLLLTVGGLVAAMRRWRRPHRGHQTREPSAAARLLARPDTGALVRTRQTAPPGPTLLLAPRVDRAVQVTVDVTPDVVPYVDPDRTFERTR